MCKVRIGKCFYGMFVLLKFHHLKTLSNKHKIFVQTFDYENWPFPQHINIFFSCAFSLFH